MTQTNRDRKLWLLRLAWVALIGLTVGLYLSHLPGLYAQAHQGTTGLGYTTAHRGELRILEVRPFSPAQQAGLEAGDGVLQIDDFVIESHMDWDAAADLLTGPVGTTVELRVQKANGGKQVYSLVRQAYGYRIVDFWANLGQFAVFVLVGVIIFLRKFDDWFAIFTSLGITLLGTGNAINSLNSGSWLALISIYTGTSLALFILVMFPDGRFKPDWTWFIGVAGSFFFASFALGWMIQPWLFDSPSLLKMYASQALGYWVNDTVYMVGQYLLYGSALAMQIYRFRKYSTAEERQLTKGVVVGISITLGVFVVLTLLQRAPAISSWLMQHPALEASVPVVFALGYIATPILYAFSVLGQGQRAPLKEAASRI